MKSPSDASADAVVCRAARREDASLLHDLLGRLAASLGTPDAVRGTPADLERFGFGDAPLFRALIAWRLDDAIGFVLFFPEYSSWRGRPGCYVQDLFVDPQHRGLGVARAMLAQVACTARTMGGTYLRLSVDRRNQNAQPFYRVAGFGHAEDEWMFVADGQAFVALADGGDV